MSATAAHTETAFEAAIEQGLTASGGYRKRKAARYDEAPVLFPEDVNGWKRLLTDLLNTAPPTSPLPSYVNLR